MEHMSNINVAIEVSRYAEELNLKARLKAIGKTQVWLITELRERGVNVGVSEMSYIINGNMTTPKARRELELSDEIIKRFD